MLNFSNTYISFCLQKKGSFSSNRLCTSLPPGGGPEESPNVVMELQRPEPAPLMSSTITPIRWAVPTSLDSNKATWTWCSCLSTIIKAFRICRGGRKPRRCSWVHAGGDDLLGSVVGTIQVNLVLWQQPCPRLQPFISAEVQTCSDTELSHLGPVVQLMQRIWKSPFNSNLDEVIHLTSGIGITLIRISSALNGTEYHFVFLIVRINTGSWQTLHRSRDRNKYKKQTNSIFNVTTAWKIRTSIKGWIKEQ